MHAVVAEFEMPEPQGEHLEYLDGIVARISQEAGFVTGYWTHDGEKAYNVLIFDSAEAAEARAADVRGNAANQRAAGLSPTLVTVARVVAHATGPVS